MTNTLVCVRAVLNVHEPQTRVCRTTGYRPSQRERRRSSTSSTWSGRSRASDSLKKKWTTPSTKRRRRSASTRWSFCVDGEALADHFHKRLKRLKRHRQSASPSPRLASWESDLRRGQVQRRRVTVRSGSVPVKVVPRARAAFLDNRLRIRPDELRQSEDLPITSPSPVRMPRRHRRLERNSTQRLRLRSRPKLRWPENRHGKGRRQATFRLAMKCLGTALAEGTGSAGWQKGEGSYRFEACRI